MSSDTEILYYGTMATNARIQKKYAPDRIFERMWKEISELSDSRSKVITLHLYVEYWLNKLLEKKSNRKRSALNRASFHGKANKLKELAVLDDKTYANVCGINRLRNIFAHELELERKESIINQHLSNLITDPYFSTNDKDLFRAVCVETVLLLEATWNNDCSPVVQEFPSASARQELVQEGQIFWQSCDLLSVRDTGPYEREWTIRCPLCNEGELVRYKDYTPGFKESDIRRCSVCGLSGDGSYLFRVLPVGVRKRGARASVGLGSGGSAAAGMTRPLLEGEVPVESGAVHAELPGDLAC